MSYENNDRVGLNLGIFGQNNEAFELTGRPQIKTHCQALKTHHCGVKISLNPLVGAVRGTWETVIPGWSGCRYQREQHVHGAHEQVSESAVQLGPPLRGYFA